MARDLQSELLTTRRGTGIATPDGRLLWADDAFCAALGRLRGVLVGGDAGDLLGFEPEEVAGPGSDRPLVRLPADGDGPAFRVTPLAAPDSPPWGLVIEVESPAGEPLPGAPAVFAVHRRGSLVALWGRSREVLGITPASIGRRLPTLLQEDPLIGVLVRRALRGETTTGLLVRGGTAREVHLFPADDPADGPPGAIGVATDAPALDHHPDAGTAPAMTPGAALAELTRAALGATETTPLLESAARLIHRALDAETCALSEYLPGGRALHVRAAVGLPPATPRLVASPEPAWPVTIAPTTGLREGNGSLVIPIGTAPALGSLAVTLGAERSFTAEEKGFVLAAAELLTAARGRLAAAEDRRRASLHDPVTGLPTWTLLQDHLRLALARSKRTRSQAALLSVGLDSFETVGETLGAGRGDELIEAVGERLLATLRPADTLGRLGATGFAVVCEDLKGDADARAVAQRLAGAFRSPFHLQGYDVSLGASIGVALAGPSTHPLAMRAEADAAMHQAGQFEGPSVVVCGDDLELHTVPASSPTPPGRRPARPS